MLRPPQLSTGCSYALVKLPRFYRPLTSYFRYPRAADALKTRFKGRIGIVVLGLCFARATHAVVAVARHFCSPVPQCMAVVHALPGTAHTPHLMYSQAQMRSPVPGGRLLSRSPPGAEQGPTNSVLRNARVLAGMRDQEVSPATAAAVATATPAHKSRPGGEDDGWQAAGDAGLSLLAKLLSPQLRELPTPPKPQDALETAAPRNGKVVEKSGRRRSTRDEHHDALQTPRVTRAHPVDDYEDVSPSAKPRPARRPRRGSPGGSEAGGRHAAGPARGSRGGGRRHSEDIDDDASSSASRVSPSDLSTAVSITGSDDVATGTGKGTDRTFTSSYHGVSWHKRSQRWAVQIRNNGKRLHVGYFGDELSAALAYDRVARQLRGERARVNFDESGERASYKKRLGSGVRPRKAHPLPHTRRGSSEATTTKLTATAKTRAVLSAAGERVHSNNVSAPRAATKPRGGRRRRVSAREIVASAPRVVREDVTAQLEKRRAVDEYFHHDRVTQVREMQWDADTVARHADLGGGIGVHGVLRRPRASILR